MKKVFAGIVVVAILIVSLPSSTSFSPATASPELVSFSVQAANIIITAPELYEQAKSLENFHDGKGTPTEVVNTTWIYTNYDEASDPPHEGYKNHSITGWDNIAGYNYSLAKRIVNYLNNGTAHPNLKYVTIFGTAKMVPPSYYIYINHDTTYNNWIPTDFFFASPEYELVPNYIVGRLPVNNTEEAEHVVQKIKNWDENVSWDWFNNVYLVGGRPDYSYYYYGELMTIDTINRNLFNGMNITKLFKSDGSLTAANVTSALSGDTGVIYIISPGDGECIYERYYFELCADDLLSLSPNPKTPVVVSIGCSNGAFDTNVYHDDFDMSFGEAVLLSDAAGIAYVGGARVTWGKPSFHMDKGYLVITKEPYMAGMLTNVFEAYHTGSNTLGEITRTAITKYVAENDFSDKKNYVTLFEFVLLGDPALELPAQQPGYSYQQPVSSAIEPAGYVAETYGTIPWYNTNTSITIHTTTDSPKVYTKRIDTHADTVVERLENNTVDGAFDYTFTSPIETEYLVRTASEDGKEGWQYVRVVFPVHNLNTSENFTSSDISIKRRSSL